MGSCAVCSGVTGTNLCAGCAEELDDPTPLVPEQIMSGWARASDAALIDVWGRAHRLESKATIGRTLTARGVSILHGSVSRQHAEISRRPDGAWFLTDVGSSNGTSVNDGRVKHAVLASGDRVVFGAVGFYFTRAVAALVDELPDAAASRTLRPDNDAAPRPPPPGMIDAPTFVGLPEISLRLFEAPSGGGGYVAVGDREIQLTDTQFSLLRILARRVTSETDVPAVMRGFVPSAHLIVDLPWDSVSPSENHVKQLVRRVRKLLDEVHLGALIESRRGFGYRLRARPRLPFEGGGA